MRWQRRRGWPRRTVSCLTWRPSRTLPVRRPPLPDGPDGPPGSELRVYLMTMGPGAASGSGSATTPSGSTTPSAEPDTAYNYGLFDFRQENFLLRFIRGQMWYWMAGYPGRAVRPDATCGTTARSGSRS